MSWRYTTIPDSMRADAEVHQRRGDAYAAQGNPDYAAGSYAKAERKRKKAVEAARILDLVSWIKR